MANIKYINGNPIVASAVELADGSLSGAALTDGSVGSAKIADGAVTTAKIDNGSVTTDKISDGAVTLAKLGGDVEIEPPDGSITDAKLVQTGGVLSLTGTALKIDALTSFVWDFGSILGTGDYNANTQYNNFFSFGILDASRFEYLYFVVPSNRKVNICYYNDSGAFVSRSADITDTTYSISRTYGIRICVSTTYNRTSQANTLDEVLSSIGIYGYVRREEPDANAIVQADLQMQMYGPTSAQASDTSIINASGVDLKSGQTLTAREGYRVALYNSNAGLITTWSESITTERPCFGAYIVVRKEPRTAIDLDTDGRTLSSYIIERITTATSKTVALKPSAIQDIVDEISTHGIDARSHWNNKKAAFVGDSITYGVNTTSGNIYYQLLDAKIGFSSVYASGVAGSCYSVTSNYGTSNSPIAERWSSIPTDCDLVVIFAGTNDWGHNTPLGTIEDTTDVSFYGALNVVINGVIEANPDVRLVLMTPLHRWGYTGGAYPNDTDNNAQGLTLSDYVDAIKNVAEIYGVPVIDLFSASGLTPRIPAIKTAYVTDGLHPNAAGHALLAQRIAPQLETL